MSVTRRIYSALLIQVNAMDKYWEFLISSASLRFWEAGKYNNFNSHMTHIPFVGHLWPLMEIMRSQNSEGFPVVVKMANRIIGFYSIRIKCTRKPVTEVHEPVPEM